MFEHVPDYPMAVTAASGADATAVRLAVKWLLQATDAVWWPAAGVRPESAEHPTVANLGGVGRPSSRHDLEKLAEQAHDRHTSRLRPRRLRRHAGPA
jgi:hypothetical protein